MNDDVLRLVDIDPAPLSRLLARFDLRLLVGVAKAPIPGSYWGDAEAGLQENRLHARDDTPLHSILHEACHYICMDSARRRWLNTDAGSDDAEESAVCYLQILLADELDGLGRERLFADMDAWGYSFRLGSSRAWFEQDAGDALDWLVERGLVDERQRPRFRLRD
ncbi:MAG: hypothetical protein OEO19_01050 [Gammaproteobacteria bacterium]|nr:hypothetical protein [Gammaproteobacteria bacterium]MDH3447343.1 hypothetical protein [Gammaproteobacteria bacterium]